MKKLCRDRIPFSVRLCAWLNIGIQTAFPLLVAFTPAATGSDRRFLQEQAQTMMQTQVYIMGEGESVASVAKKYNISLGELRRLNQFRYFAQGFNRVQPGDELDVPLTPLQDVRRDDVQSQKLASYALQTGAFLAGSDAGVSMVRGLASSTVGGEMQRWLSHFGTARVQLDVDKNLSLKNSQLDLFVPLYEKKDSLVFTQSSIHRTDDRTQSNLGLGYRWFADDWMLGANTFLDYDLSRDHARLGLGGEYWRDFLKLGVNTYHRLTNWRNSPDLEDYMERPANGWDVRAQAWVPLLPQLGGKLTYEQYYGDEVALFSRNQRQRNPHAITVGVDYTPVPLMTFRAEQRQGKAGKNDTRFGIEMNYQLGMSWQHQINPDAVASLRSLIGSRYDFVERNNNIVLEYRKKEVVSLKMANLVTGYSGEMKSLGVSVNSKYGLELIDWSASSFIAAGGKIVQSGEDWGVVMPAWRSGAEDINSYTVSGVAVDKKGNRSEQRSVQITVQTPQVSLEQSTFTPATSTLLADGKSTQVLTLHVKDENGQSVNISVSNVDMIAENMGDATVSSLKSKGDGTMEVMVTSGTQPTTLSLMPVVRGVSLPAAKVVISDSAPHAQRSSFTVSPNTITADNNSLSVLTLELMNKDGFHIEGVKDQLSLTLEGENLKTRVAAPVTLSDITEENVGIYKASLKGFQAGKYTITPQYNGVPLGNLSETVTLTADGAVQVNSTIVLDSATYTSGSDMTVTVTLKDVGNNAVTGESAILTTESVKVQNAVMKSDSGWRDNNDGTYTATYIAKTVSTGNTASLRLPDWGTDSQSTTYDVTQGDSVPSESTVSVDKATYVAGDDITVTVILKDAQHNVVTGQAGLLAAGTTSVESATLKTGSEWTESATQGTYTITYTAQTVSTSNIASVKLSDWNTDLQSSTYAITQGNSVSSESAVLVDKKIYSAGEDITVTVILKDAQHNVVTGQAALLASGTTNVENAILKTGSEWTESSTQGTYTIIYTAQSVSTGNIASVKLSDWNTDLQSSTYAITQGNSIASTSTVSVDKATYVAGDDITVTVMLKDAQHNVVTGQAGLLAAGTTNVANATLKTGSEWRESATQGTYTITYTAQTVSTSNIASVKLSDWNTDLQSSTYAITQGNSVSNASSVSVDKDSYSAGDDITVTVMLKDAQHNVVTGQAGLLTAGTTSVANATLKTGSEWTESSTQGTYTITYTAQTVSTNNIASVKLSDWNTDLQSSTYAITQGSSVSNASSVAVDKDSYSAGEDITVTVTLKDAQNNAVTGQAALLTSGTTSVENATLKTGSGWTESSTQGTYTITYTAQTVSTSNIASVKLSDWNTDLQSSTYAITQGDSVPSESTVSVDKATYVAGDDITVTVTLKDAQHNVVTGQAALLTSGTMSLGNATLKLGSEWTENATQGTYTITYTAQTISTGNMASVKLSDWNTDLQSSTYAITQGNSVSNASSVSVDKDSYSAGDDITVTVMLKDAQHNVVTGQAGLLTAGTTSVANATLKTGSEWTESATQGTYTIIYTAQTVSTGNIASVKLSDWNTDLQSSTYAITQGNSIASTSTVSVDKATYVAGDDITVIVTLKDAQHNAVTGQAGLLAAGTTSVANATLKTGSEWAESATQGTYTITYTAQTVSTGNTASVKLSDWNTDLQSSTYAITQGNSIASTSTVSVDKATYVAGDDITVTVTLKDAQHNVVTGQAALLTSGTMSLGNATLKLGSEWTESATQGTYTITYTAQTVSTGNTASVKLSGWSSDLQSSTYAITQGNALSNASAVSVDKTEYTAGEDITVTVMLKDAQNNAVTGQAAVLSQGTTSVGNATLKAGSEWTESSLPGSYIVTYTAQKVSSGNVASLTLSSWQGSASSSIQSSSYAIRQGSSTSSNSTISVNSTSYLAGNDITVVVTLKDAQNNAVTGQAAVLSQGTTSVGNATLKTGSEWTESSLPGSYIVTYTAQKVSSGNVASLTLSSWQGSASSSIQSSSYDIRQGSAVASTSVMVVNKTTYTAGSNIIVSLSLKDAQNNAVTGQAALLTSGTMSLGNATLKPDSEWVEGNTKGSYTIIYTAQTVSTGNTASLKMSHWSEALQSTSYDITQGNPVASTSTISVDKSTYTAGDDITVTVTLKDAQNNAVTGKVALLTSGRTSVGNAMLKTGSAWTESATQGTYTITYTAQTVSTSNTASLVMTNFSTIQSTTYAITQGNSVASASTISVDKSAYTAGDDITVTVTLKDAQNNAVTGQAALVSMGTTTVGNATLKTGSKWTESATQGTYTITYTAQTVSTGNVASLALSSWRESTPSSIQSATYDITDEISNSSISIAYSKSDKLPNGNDYHEVTVTVKNTVGTAVNNYPVSFESDNGATLSASLVYTNSNGEAKVTITNTKISEVNVTATIGQYTQAATVSFDIDPVISITFPDGSASAYQTFAGVTVRATITVKDSSGNLLPNIPVRAGVSYWLQWPGGLQNMGTSKISINNVYKPSGLFSGVIVTTDSAGQASIDIMQPEEYYTEPSFNTFQIQYCTKMSSFCNYTKGSVGSSIIIIGKIITGS